MFCTVFCVLFSFVGHSVDALASRADEGRCGLRYASGSWRASVIIRGCPNGAARRKKRRTSSVFLLVGSGLTGFQLYSVLVSCLKEFRVADG